MEGCKRSFIYRVALLFNEYTSRDFMGYGFNPYVCVRLFRLNVDVEHCVLYYSEISK